MRRSNNKGSILLVTTVVLFVISALCAGFFQLNTHELNFSRRHYLSAAAFWLAEAGVNMYIADPAMLDHGAETTVNYGSGTIRLVRDDSKPLYRFIHSTGTVGGVQREIRISYPGQVPDAYKNVLTSRRGIQVNGGKTSAIVNGQTRVSGTVSGTSHNADVYFDDIAEGVAAQYTGLGYQEGSAEADARDTFVNSTRDLLQGYSEAEVLYVKNTGTYTLTKEALAGKKIVYVEGAEAGGNVVINANDLVAPNQNVTVIATGTTTFNQAGQQPANSQLNIIAWGGYNESVSAPSTHRGLIYTHGTAEFNNIKESSTTTGGVVAEGGIVLGDIWSTKTFNYADMTVGGFYPPGFERFRGGSMTEPGTKPTTWKEMVH